ncbi:hypothetical protein RQ831_03875 [Roseomonas gilardii]|uniref:Uncharacterized protein n=1 Tax=Roseomonas gilardii TaxID=257708 RepID=A0ABU3MCP2_9PROT|nr:hypothetical protein [Roseomonas gilardii]MDT8330179.1 hypothetical protein [Roseomonas gilardii]
MSARHLLLDRQRRRRARIEALIERLIDALDTMDVPFVDLEPEEDDDSEAEGSLHSFTLNTCVKPVRHLRRVVCRDQADARA